MSMNHLLRIILSIPLIKTRSSIKLFKGNEVDLAVCDYFCCNLVIYWRATVSGRTISEDKNEEWTVKRPKTKQMRSHICILHNTRLVNVEIFVSLQEYKDGATKASENRQNVKEKKLTEDLNSDYRMKEVPDFIHDLVDGLDLELTRWHRKCYQSLTKNHDCLKFSIIIVYQGFKVDLKGNQLLQHSHYPKTILFRNRRKSRKMEQKRKS